MSNVDFRQLEPKLSEGTLKAIDSLGFTRMTPVQAATIPLFLTNKVRFSPLKEFLLKYN
jgi:superfamily II DNA/RNA helicase